jgi:hypothetical protein
MDMGSRVYSVVPQTPPVEVEGEEEEEEE